MAEVDGEALVAWRGEYDPLTGLGALRFVVECLLAPAIVLRAAMHTWGTLLYARDRDSVREALEARYRPFRWTVTVPDVPARTEGLVRFWAAFFALALALLVWAYQGFSAPNPAVTAIAAANWGLLVADPVLFAVEQQIRGDR